MSEMMERVARALCAANGDDPDKEYPVTLRGTVMSFGQWQKQWELVLPLAMAAIAAMREPSDPMRAAIRIFSSVPDDFEQDTVISNQDFLDAYTRGIDAALRGEG